MTTIDSTTTAPTATPAPAVGWRTRSASSASCSRIAGILLGQWLLSAAAIVLGFVARSREPHAVTTANWGLVLGFAGAFGSAILAVLAFFGLAPLFLLGSLPFWDFWG